MRKLLSFMATGALALALAAPAVSQDSPSFTDIQSIRLAPEHAQAFLDQVKIVRDAAVEIGLDAQFRWDVYRWDDEIIFVSWPESLSALENDAAMMEAFAGTAAGERVMAAMMATADMDVLEVERAISRARPELAYVPANPAVTPGDHGGVFVIEQWIKGPAAAAAFDESAQGILAMLGEMNSPYPVFVNQDITGDGGISFIVPFDNLGNFYGANSLEARLSGNPALAQRFGAHVAEHSKLISRSESRIVNYLPQFSYRPDLASASTGGN